MKLFKFQNLDTKVINKLGQYITVTTIYNDIYKCFSLKVYYFKLTFTHQFRYVFLYVN